MGEKVNAIRFALAQINPTMGAFDSNIEIISRMYRNAQKMGAQFVLCPELSLCGYPPEDLVLKPAFLQRSMKSLHVLSTLVEMVPLAVGFVERHGTAVFDSAAILQNGTVKTIYRKMMLPNYGVFDEKRYFQSGSRVTILDSGGARIAVTICEDIWSDRGPCRDAVQSGGANIIINLSASPYHLGKWQERQTLIRNRAVECGASIVYTNMIGGQDDLVFDGHSLVVSHEGNVVTQGHGFREQLLVVDVPYNSVETDITDSDRVECIALTLPSNSRVESEPVPEVSTPPSIEQEVYDALVLGTRDYIRKNGFSDVIIGLSGGIDSALVASIAVDAVGNEHVHVLFMPSEFTSTESMEDANEIADNLDIRMLELPIDTVFGMYRAVLSPVFTGYQEDITEENLQARIRGNLLMALSNKFGYLVLTTGNKSEMACGYATLYGDMAGGFALIKDVPKTMVFDLVRHRNSVSDKPWLPERLLTKPPSAELKPNQKDSDSLPPYSLLDPILQHYVEEDMGLEDITERGFERSLVLKVIRMVDQAEYKRRQAPPGIKITPKAFGRDRRLPITNRFLYKES